MCCPRILIMLEMIPEGALGRRRALAHLQGSHRRTTQSHLPDYTPLPCLIRVTSRAYTPYTSVHPLPDRALHPVPPGSNSIRLAEAPSATQTRAPSHTRAPLERSTGSRAAANRHAEHKPPAAQPKRAPHLTQGLHSREVQAPEQRRIATLNTSHQPQARMPTRRHSRGWQIRATYTRKRHMQGAANAAPWRRSGRAQTQRHPRPWS